MVRRPMWFAIGLVLLFLALGLAIRLLEPGLLYRPQPLEPGALERLLDCAPVEPGEVFLEAEIETPDGETLAAWAGIPEEPLAWVLWLHGNAGNNSHRFGEMVRLVRHARLAVLLVEYRGYGASTGRPDEEGLYLDARAAWDFLVSRGAREEEIFLLGRSLGGAVAVMLAAVRRPRGLILESTFTSVKAMARRMLPWFPGWWFVASRYPTVDRISRLDVPILLFHGERDEIVPFEQSEELSRSARPGRLTFVPVPEAGHNDVSEKLGREYFRTVVGFVEDCLAEGERD